MPGPAAPGPVQTNVLTWTRKPQDPMTDLNFVFSPGPKNLRLQLSSVSAYNMLSHAFEVRTAHIGANHLVKPKIHFVRQEIKP